MLKAFASLWILLVVLCEGTVKTYYKIEIDSSKDARLSQFENTFLSMARCTTSTVPFKEATQDSREQLRATVCVCVCVRKLAPIVMIYQSLSCVFSDSQFFLPSHSLICVKRLTHFMQYREKRTASICREGSLVCWMMSLFGEDERVGGSDESCERRWAAIADVKLNYRLKEREREGDSLQAWRKMFHF